VNKTLSQIQRFLQSPQPAAQLEWQHFLLALFLLRHRYSSAHIYLLISCNHLERVMNRRLLLPLHLQLAWPHSPALLSLPPRLYSSVRIYLWNDDNHLELGLHLPLELRPRPLHF
jgi:hypothetical protein